MARSPDPTPEEIQRRSAAIRATWSDDVRRARRCAEDRPVELRVVEEADLGLDRGFN